MGDAGLLGRTRSPTTVLLGLVGLAALCTVFALICVDPNPEPVSQPVPKEDVMAKRVAVKGAQRPTQTQAKSEYTGPRFTNLPSGNSEPSPSGWNAFREGAQTALAAMQVAPVNNPWEEGTDEHYLFAMAVAKVQEPVIDMIDKYITAPHRRKMAARREAQQSAQS